MSQNKDAQLHKICIYIRYKTFEYANACKFKNKRNRERKYRSWYHIEIIGTMMHIIKLQKIKKIKENRTFEAIILKFQYRY